MKNDSPSINTVLSLFHRLAHLFISPRFTTSAMEREVLAVESEHQKYIPDDRRRIERVESQTGRLGHPFTRYRTGTKDTLWNQPLANGIDIRATLLDFHTKHHIPTKMNLAVLGVESLDELQVMVEKFFGEIPSFIGNATKEDEEMEIEPLYGEDELEEKIEIVPKGSYRSLQLLFPLDYVEHYYKNTVYKKNFYF